MDYFVHVKKEINGIFPRGEKALLHTNKNDFGISVHLPAYR